jgi:hypothetical protein
MSSLPLLEDDSYLDQLKEKAAEGKMMLDKE